jgi:hypothetical protein
VEQAMRGDSAYHDEPSTAKPPPKKKRDLTTESLARQNRNQRRKRDFTAETRSSQSSEYILIKKLFTPRPPRLCGVLSEICASRENFELE